jgi:signal recognition particle subunit SRP72
MAAEIYAQLFEDSETRDAENDLRINKAAIDAQLEWSGKGYLVRKKRHTKDDLEVFERSFNAACASIARGEFRQAEVLLNRARRM